MQKIVIVTWNAFNGRSNGIAELLDAKPIYIGKSKKFSNSFLNALDYPWKIFKTYQAIKREKPDVVIVSNTQWIITTTHFMFRLLFNFKIVLDSHSAAFDHPFYKYPLSLSLFYSKHATMTFVTNSFHKNLVNENGGDAVLLTDVPTSELHEFNDTCQLRDNSFAVCFISTFSEDEPIEEVFKALELHADVTCYVTGNSKRMNPIVNIPENVVLTGYLSRHDYRSLLNSVDAIMCLTTRENTMQRGGSEAVTMKKPLITSNTDMLKEYFRKGSVFVCPNFKSISDGIKVVRERNSELSAEMREFYFERENSLNDLGREVLEKISKATAK